MGAGASPRIPASQYLQYLLTGLQTGVLAVLAMLVWLGVSSVWYRRTFWTAPNLLAAMFYGENALHNRFTVYTFSGLGLYLVIYGAIGMLFGLAIQGRLPSIRITCAGILSAIAWYYLAFHWMGNRFDPLLVLYTHDRPMFAGHILYGAMLGRYPKNLPGLNLRMETEEPVPMLPLASTGPASGTDLEVKD